MTHEPYAESCSNDHRNDMWTCPGCYTDLGDIGTGHHVCINCGSKIKCSIQKFESCLTEIVGVEDE